MKHAMKYFAPALCLALLLAFAAPTLAIPRDDAAAPATALHQAAVELDTTTSTPSCAALGQDARQSLEPGLTLNAGCDPQTCHDLCVAHGFFGGGCANGWCLCFTYIP